MKKQLSTKLRFESLVVRKLDDQQLRTVAGAKMACTCYGEYQCGYHYTKL